MLGFQELNLQPGTPAPPPVAAALAAALRGALAFSSAAALGGPAAEAAVAAALAAAQSACGLRVGLRELRASMNYSLGRVLTMQSAHAAAAAALRDACELLGAGARHTALGGAPALIGQGGLAGVAAATALTLAWLEAERAAPRPEPGLVAELAGSRAGFIAVGGRPWRYAKLEGLVAECRAALARADLPSWADKQAELIELVMLKVAGEALASAALTRPRDFRTPELPPASMPVLPATLTLGDTMDRARRRLVGAPCGACGVESKEAKACAACKAAFFCSVACQRAAWPAHKAACKVNAAARAAVRAP
jgi:hypothetical protein